MTNFTWDFKHGGACTPDGLTLTLTGYMTGNNCIVEELLYEFEDLIRLLLQR